MAALVMISISMSIAASALAATPDLRTLPATISVIDVESGRDGARYTLSAGRSLGPGVVVNGASLVVERRKCLSDDHPYEEGDARVVALNPRSGAVRWSRNDVTLAGLNDSLFSEPDRGAVLVRDAGGDGSTGSPHALDSRTGEELWRADAAETDVLAGDARFLIVTSRPRTVPAFVPVDTPLEVRALDRRTGAVVWRSSLGDAGAVRATVGADFVVVIAAIHQAGLPPSTASVLDLQDGTVLHTIAVGPSPAEPAVAGTTFVPQDPFGAPTAAFDSETGSSLWEGPSVSLLGATSGVFVATAASRPLSVFAIEPRSGRMEWSHPVREFYSGLYAADDVLVLSVDGDLVGIRPETGTKLWRRDFPRVKTEFDGSFLLSGAVATGSRQLFITRGCVTTSAR